MDFDTLLVKQADGVARVTLNRPERKNAFSPRMAMELRQALAALETDSAVKVMILRGAEGNFCSGGDLAGDGAAPSGEAASSDGGLGVMERCYNPAIQALHDFAKPSIAVVEGVAAGAGVNLAIGCDVVYAAEGARFAELFVRRALALDCGGTWLLPRLVGLHRAKQLAMFGEWFDAQDAMRIGLVAEVFASDELDERVDERAKKLASLPGAALSEIKRALNAAFSVGFEDSLALEAAAQSRLASSEDFRDAMRAFTRRDRG